jgi:hypothetical protein
MRKVYLAVLLNIIFINLDAQNFDWAKREGKYAYDYGYGIATDNSGNVYVAGKYEQDAIFSGTIVPCAGNHDIYLAKYTSSGALTWIQTGGGILGDYAHALACDGSSYVYIAGEIEGTGSVVNFTGSTISLTSVGDNDVCVAKYDLNGNLIWAKSEGSYESEKALGVAYDASGNVYTCGYFTDSTRFGGTAITGNGYHDIFIAKYDANGNRQWMKHAGGPGRDEALSIKCNSAGEIYICGMYSDGAVFGSTTLNTPTTATGQYLNAFLAKYSSDGTMQWVESAGGDYDDVGWSITIDNSQKVYMTGEFHAYALFDSYALTTNGHGDVFVAAYDASGNAQWAVGAGGTLSDRARGIGTDGNNLYITGQFGSSVNFGSSTVIAMDSSDIFMAGLDNTGAFLWSKSVSGPADPYEPLGYESGNAICADGPNSIYATGALLNGGTFGVFTFNDYDRTDVFITKLNMLVGVDEQEAENLITAYPNPSNGHFDIDLSALQATSAEIKVYNYLGETVSLKKQKASSLINVDISTQDKGIYVVELQTDKKVYRKKIILQ